jgi:hypothetical protein
MGGGLMQLVAYGAQDIYLTGNPQITFFKVVYRRHTNFAMEAVQQTLSGTPDFGNKVTATISRNGDLVGRMYVECDPSDVLKETFTFAPNPLHQLLKEMTVEIGGQQIDKHYGHWLNVWTELTEPTNVSILDNTGRYATAVTTRGADTEARVPPTPYQRMAFGVKSDGATVPVEKRAAVPLQFWFCRNAGLALPLIALQYHEVKVSITFDTEANVRDGTGSLSSVQLWADYIYLDTDERRRFAQVSHEYLIEQLQYQSSGPASSHKLNFNHPVKELVWCGQRSGNAGVHGGSATPMRIALHSNSGTKIRDTNDTVTLKLNGHDRFAARHDTYFTRTQPWQHHSNPGGGPQADAISVYSFALKPEEHQPSGTCNFSRIDNAQLVFSNKVCGGSSNDGLHIYAVNYNVLRVMSGMGGLAYSN